jgi:ElaB/YqjD/DUF883 family membrane-anchored ribosome-binding protein
MASTKQYAGTETPERMGETLEEAEKGVRNLLPSASTGTEVRAMVRDVRRMAEGQVDAVMTWIKHRPVTSVLIGAAVGYLLGRIARR